MAKYVPIFETEKKKRSPLILVSAFVGLIVVGLGVVAVLVLTRHGERPLAEHPPASSAPATSAPVAASTAPATASGASADAGAPDGGEEKSAKRGRRHRVRRTGAPPAQRKGGYGDPDDLMRDLGIH
jgi:hypothetical protein